MTTLDMSGPRFGDVSIYRARGGRVDFGGDHMVFNEGETDRGSVVAKRR